MIKADTLHVAAKWKVEIMQINYISWMKSRNFKFKQNFFKQIALLWILLLATPIKMSAQMKFQKLKNKL